MDILKKDPIFNTGPYEKLLIVDHLQEDHKS